ncbi:MAG: nucleotidyltransferase family protein, partial [Betaproteobacteria bacterium]
SLLGVEVAWPRPEDLLLVLCLHGCKHRWGEVKWVVDVAELIRARPDLNWSLLMETARHAGSYRMVGLGLLLASHLLGAAVPVSVIERIRATPPICALADEVCHELFDAPRKPDADPRLFSFLARAADRIIMRLSFRILPLGYVLMRRLVRPGMAALRRAMPD